MKQFKVVDIGIWRLRGGCCRERRQEPCGLGVPRFLANMMRYVGTPGMCTFARRISSLIERFSCIITRVDTFTFLIVYYFAVRYLEMLVCGLVSTKNVCIFISWGDSGTNGVALVRGMRRRRSSYMTGCRRPNRGLTEHPVEKTYEKMTMRMVPKSGLRLAG